MRNKKREILSFDDTDTDIVVNSRDIVTQRLQKLENNLNNLTIDEAIARSTLLFPNCNYEYETGNRNTAYRARIGVQYGDVFLGGEVLVQKNNYKRFTRKNQEE